MNPDKTLRLSSYTIQVELNDRKNQVLPIALGTAADSAMQLSTECFTCTLCFTCGEFL